MMRLPQHEHDEAVEGDAEQAAGVGRVGAGAGGRRERGMGTNVAGKAATKLRVVVTPEGIVKTAFPF